MAESKYGKYICTELKKEIQLPGFRAGPSIGQGMVNGVRRMMEHMIWMDDTVIPGAFYSEMVWFWPQIKTETVSPEKGLKGPNVPPHVHPFTEIVGYFGTDVNQPQELNGEIELWLEDEQFNLTKSFMCYIPAGMRHCPLRHIRMDKAFFHFTMGPGMQYK
jgi:hypothetical protein